MESSGCRHSSLFVYTAQSSANYGAWRVSSLGSACAHCWQAMAAAVTLTTAGCSAMIFTSFVKQNLKNWTFGYLHSWWPLFLRFHPLTTNIWFLSGNNEVLVKQITCENSKKLGLTYSKNHTFDDFHVKIWF